MQIDLVKDVPFALWALEATLAGILAGLVVLAVVS
jgi:hypothetical protein